MSDLVLKPDKKVTTVCAEIEREPVQIDIVDVDKEMQRSTQSIYDKAYAEGFEEGKNQGSQQEIEENESLIKQLHRLFEELVVRRNALLYEAETFILRLVMAISEKVIRHELEENPHYVQTMVRETLNYVVDKDIVVVRVHPDDLVTVQSIPEDSPLSLADFKKLEFVEDAAVERGGCIVETNSGIIEATLKVKLEEIEANLLERTYDE